MGLTLSQRDGGRRGIGDVIIGQQQQNPSSIILDNIVISNLRSSKCYCSGSTLVNSVRRVPNTWSVHLRLIFWGCRLTEDLVWTLFKCFAKWTFGLTSMYIWIFTTTNEKLLLKACQIVCIEFEEAQERVHKHVGADKVSNNLFSVVTLWSSANTYSHSAKVLSKAATLSQLSITLASLSRTVQNWLGIR